jgi:hypothetical protein
MKPQESMQAVGVTRCELPHFHKPSPDGACTMMTTIPVADTILAIDLGKYKSVACAFDRAHPDHPRSESATTSQG